MANRVVSPKEFRSRARIEIVSVCDFSRAGKSKHILGIGPRQMSIDVGVEVVRAVKREFESDGRSLDKDLADLHTPRGERRYVSSQLGQLSRVRLVSGANAIETGWKSLGEIIVTGRNKRLNVYVAKNGAMDMEINSYLDLLNGKLNARIHDTQALTHEIIKTRDALVGRSLGQAYAEDCAQYFKALPAAE